MRRSGADRQESSWLTLLALPAEEALPRVLKIAALTLVPYVWVLTGNVQILTLLLETFLSKT